MDQPSTTFRMPLDEESWDLMLGTSSFNAAG